MVGVCFVTCKEGRYILYGVYRKVCDNWKTNKIATRSGVVFGNLIFPCLIKKFSASYVTRRIITVYKTACYLPLSSAQSVHSTPLSYLHKVHFNIILPYTSRSSKWFISVRVCHHCPVGSFTFYGLIYLGSAGDGAVKSVLKCRRR